MIEWVIDYAYCVILPNFRQPEIIFAMSLQRLWRCVLPCQAKLDCHDFATQNLAMTRYF